MFHESFLEHIITISLVFLGTGVLYFKWKYQYWKQKNIPSLEPRSPFGHLQNALLPKEHLGTTLSRIYMEMKTKNWRHGGVYFFAKPIYFLVDLNKIKKILTQNFDYFTDRPLYSNEKDDPLSYNILTAEGKRWKNMRSQLSPVFTPCKLKAMVSNIIECGDHLEKEITAKREKVDIYSVAKSYSTNLSINCGTGINLDSVEKVKTIIDTYAVYTPYESILKLTFSTTFQNFLRRLGVAVHPKSSSNLFFSIISSRKKTLENFRSDKLSSSIKHNFLRTLMTPRSNHVPSFKELACHSYGLMGATVEFTAVTITMALFEIAKNQTVQEKLREEIKSIIKIHDGCVTYEGLQEMKYADQVLQETLRKYPPMPFILRKCVKDYTADGVTIEKGILVVVPVLGIHYDPEYYPEPDKFDPERFTEINKAKRNQYAHIPWGEGPRICIGERFAMIAMKIALISALKKYKLTLNKHTSNNINMSTRSIPMKPEDPIWLDVYQID